MSTETSKCLWKWGSSKKNKRLIVNGKIMENDHKPYQISDTISDKAILRIFGAQHSMDWFKGKSRPESPMIFMGQSMVSGLDFPNKTNPVKQRNTGPPGPPPRFGSMVPEICTDSESPKRSLGTPG